MARNRTVVRVIMVGDQHGDWFGHEHDRHNAGELLNYLARVRPDAIKFHDPTGDAVDKYVFDILPPPNVDDRQWAKMNAERLQATGFNAAAAPEWKDLRS